MVTILPKEDDWANAFSQIGSGLTQGYMQRSDENAVRKAITDLGPNASARDIMNALLNAKTYNNEAKQQALSNILGVEKFEEMKRHAQEQERHTREQEKIGQAKNAIQLAKQQREMDRDERNTQLGVKKEQEERNRVRGLVDQLELPEDQKNALGESLTLKGAEDLIKTQLKPKEGSIFNKKLQEKSAQEFIDLSGDIEKIQSTLDNIKYAGELSDEVGLLGTAAGLVGLSPTAKQLEGIGFALMEPIVKIFNPSGPIAQQKLKMIQDKYAIQPTDLPWNRKAKLNALQRFATQAMERAKNKMAIIKKYEGNPPADVLDIFNKETDTLSDAMLDYDLTGEGGGNGKTMTSPNGEKKKMMPNKEEEGWMSESSSQKALKGFASGALFGLSEKVPLLKGDDSFAFHAGKFLGSFIPLSKLFHIFNGPAMKLASKSPILQRQLGSLATMFGVGAATKAIEDVVEGEVISAEDLLGHGVAWAALDAVIQTAGFGGRFAKALLTRSKQTGLPRSTIVTNLSKQLEEAGIDLSAKVDKTRAEEIGEKALEILERPIEESELNLADKEITKQILPNPAEAQKAEGLAQEQAAKEVVTPKDLKTREVSKDAVNGLKQERFFLAQPYQPVELSFTKEADKLANDGIGQKLESSGARATTEEELGNAIREDVEKTLNAEKEEYRPFYQQAEEAAGSQVHVPRKTANVAGEKLLKLSRLSTKPEGYPVVLRKLETALQDSGFMIQRDEKGNIEKIISQTEVPVSDTIELARRLNEMVDYEAIEPTVKEVLRVVAKAAKQDIRTALASNPDALAAFELAEEAHANTARKFGRNNIRNIRRQQSGEKIAKMVESPSVLGDLKGTISPAQKMQVEREVLEKLNAKEYDQAKKMLREVERHLSDENKKLAREIVEAKNPHSTTARTKMAQEAVLNDMSNAFTTGTRPEKTLKLWRTTKGRNVVEDAFKDSPNWPSIKNYLEQQSFSDMVASVLKDGKLDFAKFKEFMRDPATLRNIRDIGGEEAVSFFKGLDVNVKQLEQNEKLLEYLPGKSQAKRGVELLKRQTEGRTSKVGREAIGQEVAARKNTSLERGRQILQDIVEKQYPIQTKIKKWRQFITEVLGINEKGVLSVFSLMKLGLPNTVSLMLGYRMLEVLATSPQARRAFTTAASRQSDPFHFILALKTFGQMMEDHSKSKQETNPK